MTARLSLVKALDEVSFGVSTHLPEIGVSRRGETAAGSFTGTGVLTNADRAR